MDSKRYYRSGADWEDIAGYSRGVRVGNSIEIAGTTSMRNGQLIGKNDIYLQTKTVLEIIKEAIEGLEGKLSQVIRTRIYITDISQWELVAKAHGEIFGEIKPACTMVEVSALIDPDLLVEIEASAIVV